LIKDQKTWFLESGTDIICIKCLRNLNLRAIKKPIWLNKPKAPKKGAVGEKRFDGEIS